MPHCEPSHEASAYTCAHVYQARGSVECERTGLNRPSLLRWGTAQRGAASLANGRWALSAAVSVCLTLEFHYRQAMSAQHTRPRCARIGMLSAALWEPCSGFIYGGTVHTWTIQFIQSSSSSSSCSFLIFSFRRRRMEIDCQNVLKKRFGGAKLAKTRSGSYISVAIGAIDSWLATFPTAARHAAAVSYANINARTSSLM